MDADYGKVRSRAELHHHKLKWHKKDTVEQYATLDNAMCESKQHVPLLQTQLSQLLQLNGQATMSTAMTSNEARKSHLQVLQCN